MPGSNLPRVGYVLKMYPRFSETFILSEILAHEAAGLSIEVFSLRSPLEGRFHESLARVRAPVHYPQAAGLKASDLWEAIRDAGDTLPGLWDALASATHEDPIDVYQAVIVATIAVRQRIDHLHAHFASVATTVARLAAKMAGITYSFTGHAKDIFHESVDADDLRVKLREAAGVVTVSEFNLEFLRDQFGADARTVRRIYNGLDLEEFAYQSPASRERIVVAVGRLVEKKGFDVLLEACAILRDRRVFCRTIIIGSGEHEAAMREQRTRLGLESHAEMLGPRPRSEVIRLVRQSKVLAVPCVVGNDGNRDGLPTVLLEAMALGTPCIATDVTGIPEIVRHGDTGWMIPQRDAEALARAIEHALDAEAEAVKLAANARALIEAEFDIHRNTTAMRRLFAERRTPISTSARAPRAAAGVVEVVGGAGVAGASP